MIDTKRPWTAVLVVAAVLALLIYLALRIDRLGSFLRSKARVSDCRSIAACIIAPSERGSMIIFLAPAAGITTFLLGIPLANRFFQI
jgi:hypothetical protein